MSYLTVEEFKKFILTTPLRSVVQQYIFAGIPYVFQKRSKDLQLLANHLCAAMPIKGQDVAVVGSAKVGFSLNPDNFPRLFSDNSDIDIIVISEGLFDRVWMTLLEWQYPRRLLNLGRFEGEWAQLRRKEIYWGWLVPTEVRYDGLSFPDILKPLRDISANWFNAFQGLSLYPEFAARTISGRLYRTWEHALRYHMEGLRLIRERILTSQKGG